MVEQAEVNSEENMRTEFLAHEANNVYKMLYPVLVQCMRQHGITATLTGLFFMTGRACSYHSDPKAAIEFAHKTLEDSILFWNEKKEEINAAGTTTDGSESRSTDSDA